MDIKKTSLISKGKKIILVPTCTFICASYYPRYSNYAIKNTNLLLTYQDTKYQSSLFANIEDGVFQ